MFFIQKHTNTRQYYCREKSKTQTVHKILGNKRLPTAPSSGIGPKLRQRREQRQFCSYTGAREQTAESQSSAVDSGCCFRPQEVGRENDLATWQAGQSASTSTLSSREIYPILEVKYKIPRWVCLAVIPEVFECFAVGETLSDSNSFPSLLLETDKVATTTPKKERGDKRGRRSWKIDFHGNSLFIALYLLVALKLHFARSNP